MPTPNTCHICKTVTPNNCNILSICENNFKICGYPIVTVMGNTHFSSCMPFFYFFNLVTVI